MNDLDLRIEMIAVRLGLDLAIHNQAAYHTDENEIKRIVSIEPKSKTFTDYTLAK